MPNGALAKMDVRSPMAMFTSHSRMDKGPRESAERNTKSLQGEGEIFMPRCHYCTQNVQEKGNYLGQPIKAGTGISNFS